MHCSSQFFILSFHIKVLAWQCSSDNAHDGPYKAAYISLLASINSFIVIGGNRPKKQSIRKPETILDYNDVTCVLWYYHALIHHGCLFSGIICHYSSWIWHIICAMYHTTNTKVARERVK